MGRRSDDADTDMHRDVSWLRPADRRILQELEDIGGRRWQKPATMALNVPYSRQTIAERLLVLAEKGLTERESENIAAYRITESGREFLRMELSADELEAL